MEVHCKNCKFKWRHFNTVRGVYLDCCEKGIKQFLEDNNGDKDFCSVLCCKTRNKKQNCKDYKKIWYKFWVK